MSNADRLAKLTELRDKAVSELEGDLRFRHEGPPSPYRDPPVPWTDADRAEERRLVELIAGYDAAIASELNPASEGHTANETRRDQPPAEMEDPVHWRGETWQWVDAVLRWKEEGFIKADSPTAALNQVAPHFRDKHGKPFNVTSALQSFIRNKNPKRS